MCHTTKRHENHKSRYKCRYNGLINDLCFILVLIHSETTRARTLASWKCVFSGSHFSWECCTTIAVTKLLQGQHCGNLTSKRRSRPHAYFPQSKYEVFTSGNVEEIAKVFGIDSNFRLSLMTGLVNSYGIGKFIIDGNCSIWFALFSSIKPHRNFNNLAWIKQRKQNRDKLRDDSYTFCVAYKIC